MTNNEPYVVFPEGKYADNTVLLFQKQWRNWVDYCDQNQISAFPVAENHLLGYLKAQDWQYATVRVVIDALKAVHRNCDEPIDFEGKLLDVYLKSRLRKRQPQKQARGLRIHHLITILNHKGIHPKHKAMVSLMFDTLCRRSEIVAIKWDDFRVEVDEDTGEQTVVLQIPKSKGNQYGQYLDYRYVSDHTWARLQQIRLEQHDTVDKPFDISKDAITKLFRRLSSKLNITPAFTSHSCRVGAAQELMKSGASDIEICRAGGWSSKEMVNRYTRHLSVHSIGMAKYFKGLPIETRLQLSE